MPHQCYEFDEEHESDPTYGIPDDVFERALNELVGCIVRTMVGLGFRIESVRDLGSTTRIEADGRIAWPLSPAQRRALDELKEVGITIEVIRRQPCQH